MNSCSKDKGPTKPRIMIVTGSGGHAAQMERLLNSLSGTYEFTFILEDDDLFTRRRFQKFGCQFFSVPPFRNKCSTLTQDVFQALRCLWASWRLYFLLKPEVMVSAGPGLAIGLGILTRLGGGCLIFIESWSRVETCSLTGRILYPFSNLFFVQWPQLQKKYPRSAYQGRLDAVQVLKP